MITSSRTVSTCRKILHQEDFRPPLKRRSDLTTKTSNSRPSSGSSWRWPGRRLRSPVTGGGPLTLVATARTTLAKSEVLTWTSTAGTINVFPIQSNGCVDSLSQHFACCNCCKTLLDCIIPAHSATAGVATQPKVVKSLRLHRVKAQYSVPR